MKNKDHVWRQRTGETLALKDMETTHLINTVIFLTKRQAEYDGAFAKAVETGVLIPVLEINGETTEVWIARMTKELARRRRKDVDKAQHILEVAKGNT